MAKERPFPPEKAEPPDSFLLAEGLARLLVHQGKDRKAWELLTFIGSQPKIEDESRIKVAELQKTLKARLSAQERVAVEKRRGEEELEPLVREVLLDFNLGTLSVQGFRSA